MNRIDNYERMYLGEKLEMPDKASRIDALWQAILNKEALPFEPVTRVEKYLAKMIDSSIETPNPTTRLEEILCAICNGEKVDEATKLSCKDEYLKYIYELTSGENMFYPNNKPTKNGILCNGRTITLNGELSGFWAGQNYKSLPLVIGDNVTIRYKYKSGTILNSDAVAIFSILPTNVKNNKWATRTTLDIGIDNYNKNQVLVTEYIVNADSFSIQFTAGTNAKFDNLTFEVSFEKGDTTK